MSRPITSNVIALALAWFLTAASPLAGQTARQGNAPIGPRQARRTPPPAANRTQPLVMRQAPFRLTPKQQDHLDRVLRYWEYKSSQVKTYQCRFTRWEYDRVFGPKDPNQAKAISHGVIRYAAPDKGLFQVESVGNFTPPRRDGEQPTYPQKKVEHAEHWVCDGKSLFEFNAKTKQLIETQLPPDLQGKAITDGPLPFLFGAKADKLKKRYWIREQTPPAGAKEYWLEAYPKTRQDAANFQRVEVILDQKFLPTALQLYPPNYDPKLNPSRMVYQFQDQKVNNLVNQVQGFMNSFVRPRKPSGWTKHVEAYSQPARRVAPARMRSNQARRPTPVRLR